MPVRKPNARSNSVFQPASCCRNDQRRKTVENNGGHGFVSGLLLGATLGAMAALLLAPSQAARCGQTSTPVESD